MTMPRDPLHPRNAYRWWRPITTRWSDNDAYGHVNNAVYYHWFDTAVNAWLIEAGLLDVGAGDPIGLVVETSCRYVQPLSYPDPVEIGLAIERLGTSSVTYHLGAFPPDDADVAAQASFTHVYVDRATRRPVPLPAAWRDRMAMLLSPYPA
jgi:acyl-CoA thioester hydrolase